jgi:hypothetical protein
VGEKCTYGVYVITLGVIAERGRKEMQVEWSRCCLASDGSWCSMFNVTRQRSTGSASTLSMCMGGVFALVFAVIVGGFRWFTVIQCVRWGLAPTPPGCGCGKTRPGSHVFARTFAPRKVKRIHQDASPRRHRRFSNYSKPIGCYS